MHKAVIKLKCYNTPTTTHPEGQAVETPFEYIQMDEHLLGHASSSKVQFNVNKPAVPGTIFVNEKNDGVAIATIEGDFILTEGRVSFDPLGSSTVNSQPYDKINDSVKVTWVATSNKQIVFTVRQIGNDVGNITLIFFVSYKKTF